jgi:methylamine---glutamate N-methyltransferase subunit B
VPEAPLPQADWDLTQNAPGAINAHLRAWAEAPPETLTLQGAAGQPGLATGLHLPLSLKIQGNCGPFAGLLNAGGELDIEGDTGTACGHSMSSGSILIRGNAGDSLGAFARGGFIGVHQSAGDRCGLMVDGADIVVRLGVGRCAGYRMQSGNLVIGGDAGEELGYGCVGGTIFLRGNAASLAPQLKEMRLRDADAMRLSLLLVRAGIRAATKDFRMLRPRSGANS